MDYNAVLKEHDHLIVSASRRFPVQERKDIAQEIRIWVYGALTEYDQYEDRYPIGTYIRNQIGFCLRRLYYDVKKQEQFERDLVPYSGEDGRCIFHDSTDEFVKDILKKLTPKDQCVFFCLIYDSKGRNYRQLASLLRLEYASFRNSVGKIKKITKNVLEIR